MDDKDSQCKIILVWLKEKGYINAKIARQLCACERLAARINDLRRKGIPIQTEMNISSLFVAQMASLAVSSTSSGDFPSMIYCARITLAVVINSAAGIPFPETSAMTMYR
jgi:hypothetical protein